VRDNRSITSGANPRDHTRVLLRNNIIPRILLIIHEQRYGEQLRPAPTGRTRSRDLSTFNEIVNFLPVFSFGLISKNALGHLFASLSFRLFLNDKVYIFM